MKRPKILIADDDRDLVRVLSMRAAALDIDTIVAHDALTALELCHREWPDAVLLDVAMPAGNGLGAGEMIKGDQQIRDIPVIMLTGRSDAETIRRCHTMGAYYVLKSADTWSHLEPVLRDVLDLPPALEPRSTGDAHHVHPARQPRGLTRLCRLIGQAP